VAKPAKDLARYAQEIEPEIFTDYQKFAVVRNPWTPCCLSIIFKVKKNLPERDKLFAVDHAACRKLPENGETAEPVPL
jgi:hypothetical protein